jgi:hypothetical protein
MYGTGSELAAMLGRPESPFAGLARRSGFSVRDCEVAAASGQLAGIVRVAEKRSRPGRGGCLPGSVALARIRALEAASEL